MTNPATIVDGSRQHLHRPGQHHAGRQHDLLGGHEQFRRGTNGWSSPGCRSVTTTNPRAWTAARQRDGASATRVWRSPTSPSPGVPPLFASASRSGGPSTDHQRRTRTVANPIPDQTATADTEFSYEVPANTFNDVDTGDTLSYAATKGDGTNLPTWLSFDAATRTFTGTPTASDVETVAVEVTANDSNGGTVSDEFNIEVSAATTAASLVSNLGQTQHSGSLPLNSWDVVQGFETGASRYTLVSVDLRLNRQSGGMSIGVPSVKLMGGTKTATSVTLTGQPVTLTAEVAEVTSTTGENYTFTAPSGTTLSASTRYFVVAERVGTRVQWMTTASTGEDAPPASAAGWSIDDERWRRNASNTGNFTNKVDRSQLLRVNGNTNTSTNAAPTVANTIPDQTATAGTLFSYQVPDTTFTDTDTGQTLSYMATKADGMALPTWLAFTAGTRTFAGTPTASDVETVSVRVTASDGNGGSVSDDFDIEVSAADTTAPAFESAVVNGTSLVITFNEDLAAAASLANSAFTVKKGSGGTVQTLSGTPSISGKTVTLTLATAVTATDTAVKVTYTKPTTGSANKLVDLSGNETATFTDQSVDNALADSTAPVLATTDPAVLAADGVTLTLTYNEALKAASVPAASTFTVQATPMGGSEATLALAATDPVAVTGSTVVLTLATPAAHDDGSVKVSYTKPTSGSVIEDTNGNDAANLTDQAVTNNSAVPRVSIAAVHPDASPAIAQAVFEVTRSNVDANNALDVMIEFTQVDTWYSSTTQTITIGSGATSATKAFASHYTGNTSGNLVATVAGGDDHLPALAPANAATVAYKVPATGPVAAVAHQGSAFSVNEADPARFNIVVTTGAGVAQPRESFTFAFLSAPGTATVNKDYKHRSVNVPVEVNAWTAANGRYVQTVTVDVETLADDEYEDDETFTGILDNTSGVSSAISIASQSGAGTATVTILDDDPTLGVSGVSVTSMPATGTVYDSGEDISITVTFNGVVAVTGAPRFAFDLGGAARHAAYASGTDSPELVFTYTVAAGDEDHDGLAWAADSVDLNGGAIKFKHTDPAEQINAGLGHRAQPALSDHTVDAAAPRLVSAHAADTNLVLVFSEDLAAAASLANSAFTVKKTPAGGSEATQTLGSTAPAIAGKMVTLTLATASAVVASDTNVKVSYTKPTTGSANKLVDATGHETASFADQPVVNQLAETVPPELQTAAVDGAALVLTYNEPLDTTSVPAAGDFVVRVSGSARGVSTVAASGAAVTLTLASAVDNSDTVTVSYTVGTNPIRDIARNGAADFMNRAVDNTTVSAPDAPGGVSASPGNGRVTLSWDAPADNGGAAIVRYEYRVSADGGTSWAPDWTGVPDGADPGSDAADERTFGRGRSDQRHGLPAGGAGVQRDAQRARGFGGRHAPDGAGPRSGCAAQPECPGPGQRGDPGLVGAVGYRQPVHHPLRGAPCRARLGAVGHGLDGRGAGVDPYREQPGQRRGAHVRGAGGELGGPGGSGGAGAGHADRECRRAERRAGHARKHARRGGAAVLARAGARRSDDDCAIPVPVCPGQHGAVELALVCGPVPIGHGTHRRISGQRGAVHVRGARGEPDPGGRGGTDAGHADGRPGDADGRPGDVDGRQPGHVHGGVGRSVRGAFAIRAGQAAGVRGRDAALGDTGGRRQRLHRALRAPPCQGHERAFEHALAPDRPQRAGSEGAQPRDGRALHVRGAGSDRDRFRPGGAHGVDDEALQRPGRDAVGERHGARGPAVHAGREPQSHAGLDVPDFPDRGRGVYGQVLPAGGLCGRAVPGEHDVHAGVRRAPPAAAPPHGANRGGVRPVDYAIDPQVRSVTVHDDDAGLRVDNATVREGPGARLSFVVRLDRTRERAVTVHYATSDGTAAAGQDYTAASGTLTIPAGSRRETIAVAVLDDAINDDGETLTLTLSNAQGAVIDDATATGTIRNRDPLPQAWLARFGRTVGEQAMEAVQARIEGPRAAGLSGSIGGIPGLAQTVGQEAEVGARARRGFENEPAPRGNLETLAGWLSGGDDAAKEPVGVRLPTGRELLAGTSFALTGGTSESRFASFWGRGAVTSFDGRDGETTVDGEVASAMVGADWSNDALLRGLMVSHSRGEGSYRMPAGNGEVESTLTALYPYARHALSERVSVWGMGGYGEGTLTLTPEGQAPLRPDLDLVMGALGVQLVLLDGAGGARLAVKSDAFAARTSTGAVPGLSASHADVTRLRLALEGTRPLALGDDAVLTPRVEFGLRHDGGDAETGFGADIGAGLSLSAPSRGLSAELRARGLLTHEAEGMRERGLSGTLTFDPAPDSERGLSLSLAQTVGAQSEGGADALFERTTLAGLGAEQGASDSARRLEARLGYGFGVFGDRFTAVPELGLGLSEGTRELRLGGRLAERVTSGLAFELEVEATRREPAHGDAGPEFGLGVGLGWRLAGDAATDPVAFEMRIEAAQRDVADDDSAPDRHHRDHGEHALVGRRAGGPWVPGIGAPAPGASAARLRVLRGPPARGRPPALRGGARPGARARRR